ncbi:hypothetical protein [Clostridium perfringens]|uniref:hypothetical protein n=1 Tax=Clostridium perfringens TaxID=1502 RepID=UPI0024BC7D00|nr:hypothetical protein [Clostridium perfringens]
MLQTYNSGQRSFRRDTINNVEATRRARDIRDEINRNIRGEEQDDNHFYTENEDAFNSDFENITDSSVQYEYENVLNGNTSTFGIELEFVGGDADAIARELYDLGIVSAPRRLNYHSRSEPGKWKFEREGSVSDGDAGGDLGRVRSNTRHYATPFSPRADESKYIHFNMDTDEDVRRMAAEISEGNRYYVLT